MLEQDPPARRHEAVPVAGLPPGPVAAGAAREGARGRQAGVRRRHRLLQRAPAGLGGHPRAGGGPQGFGQVLTMHRAGRHSAARVQVSFNPFGHGIICVFAGLFCGFEILWVLE